MIWVKKPEFTLLCNFWICISIQNAFVEQLVNWDKTRVHLFARFSIKLLENVYVWYLYTLVSKRLYIHHIHRLTTIHPTSSPMIDHGADHGHYGDHHYATSQVSRRPWSWRPMSSRNRQNPQSIHPAVKTKQKHSTTLSLDHFSHLTLNKRSKIKSLWKSRWSIERHSII